MFQKNEMNIMPVKGETMSTGNVPAFLTKLWNLVENPVYDYLIAWDVSGNSFHCFDQGRFAKEILPMYFKHNNMASFIRQLNMYGFRKVVHIEQGLKSETDDVEFQHPYFQRGQEQLLEHIKRKISGHPPSVKVEPVGVKLKPEDVSKVLNEVRSMKGKQDSMNNKLESMKRENEVLWRELASLRQKHIKQQQIVNKLIQFLVHLVSGNRGVKRSLPLMISDANSNESTSTVAKLPKYESNQYSVQSPQGTSYYSDQNVSGPTIHDVTDTFQGMKDRLQCKEEAATPPNIDNLTLPQDFLASPLITTTEEDEGDNAQLDIDHLSRNLASNISELPDQLLSADIPNTAPSTSDTQATSSSSSSILGSLPSDKQVLTKSLSRQSSISEMSDHLESLHYDLEGLKDVLTSNQYNFDPRTLLGMFKDMDPDVKNENTDQSESLLDSSTGSELVQYRTGEDFLPALFDLADLSHYDPDPDLANLTGEDGSANSSALETSLQTPICNTDDLD